MNFLFGLILSGIVGTLVFFILLLLQPITKKLFSKSWHYYSLFVPLFFLLGGTVIAGALTNGVQHFVIENGNTVFEIGSQTKTSQNPFHIPLAPSFGGMEFNMYPEAGSNEGALPPSPATTITPVIHLFEDQLIARFLIICWALGAILFIGISIRNYLKYRHLLLHNAEHYRHYDCQIPIIISPTTHTPMLIGLLKPIIVLPKMPLEDEQLEVILKHELVHYKRKDLLLKMVGLVAHAVHWFNPAVYILNRQLNIYCELSCDEKVVSEMDLAGKKYYGELILQFLQYGTAQHELPKYAMLSTNLCNSKKISKGD